MAENFKSSSIRLYFLEGYDGDKELRISKVYPNVREGATFEILEAFKNQMGSLTDLKIVAAEVIVTKMV